MPDLEESPARGARALRERERKLLAAARAELAAQRSGGRSRHSSTPSMRAPFPSIAPVRALASIPRARYAATIASPIRRAESSSAAKANDDGPLPEIEQPSAPADSAADFASANPGRSGARAGSAIRSSTDRRRRS